MSEKTVIGVFGLGYVGSVTAACLAGNGHTVIGIDTDKAKVDCIIGGEAPVFEPGLDQLTAEAVSAGRLVADTDPARALASVAIVFVCVGTPSGDDGSVDTTHVLAAATDIGRGLKEYNRDGVSVVLRSTVLPGTTRNVFIPALEEAAGQRCGARFDVMHHPEFLREGSSVADFKNPSRIVVGEREPGGGKGLLDLYLDVQAPRFITRLEASEMLKYTDNAFHALKVTFANEIGQLSRRLDVDSRELLSAFVEDHHLTISSAYLRPGFAFGGSCLPKDVRALASAARRSDLSLPVLQAILPSNDSQVRAVADRIRESGVSSLGLVGLAFKPGTDDLRESALVMLAGLLAEEDIDVRIYDPVVETKRLAGANKAFVDRHLPRLDQMLVPTLESLDNCQAIVLGHPLEDDDRLLGWLRQSKWILDLVGKDTIPDLQESQGLYW